MNDRLTRVETLLTTLTEQNAKILDDHENRLRSVEKYRWIQTGGSGAVGALLTLALSIARAHS